MFTTKYLKPSEFLNCLFHCLCDLVSSLYDHALWHSVINLQTSFARSSLQLFEQLYFFPVLHSHSLLSVLSPSLIPVLFPTVSDTNPWCSLCCLLRTNFGQIDQFSWNPIFPHYFSYCSHCTIIYFSKIR